MSSDDRQLVSVLCFCVSSLVTHVAPRHGQLLSPPYSSQLCLTQSQAQATHLTSSQPLCAARTHTPSRPSDSVTPTVCAFACQPACSCVQAAMDADISGAFTLLCCGHVHSQLSWPHRDATSTAVTLFRRRCSSLALSLSPPCVARVVCPHTTTTHKHVTPNTQQRRGCATGHHTQHWLPHQLPKGG